MQVTFATDPDAAYAQYMRGGFFIEPDVLTASECDRIIEEGEKLPNAVSGSYILMMNPHLSVPLFADIMSHPRIVSIMRRLVHGLPVGLQSKMFYVPTQRAGLGVHQDNYFVEAKADAFASAWLPLIDVDKNNGGVYAYAGSHHQGLLPVKPMNVEGRDKRETTYEETVVPEEWIKQDITIKRGSVLFLHAYNVHGSYPNLSGSKRYVVLNTYICKGEAFRSGNTARRQECPLTTTS